jgi:hypothetical protein
MIDQSFRDNVKKTVLASINRWSSAITNAIVFDRTGRVYYEFGRGCHSFTSSITSNPKAVVSCYYGYNKHSDFVKWYTDKEESVWSPMFKHMGDDYEVIVDPDTGVPCASVIYNFDKYNFKLLVNFMKGTRTLTEHVNKISFWKKYKEELGYNPSLVYLLMYYINIDGYKITNGHSSIETWSNIENKIPINLSAFVRKDHNSWDFNKHAGSRSYTGENKETWGGKCKYNIKEFFPYEIPEVNTVKEKTFFYSIHNRKEVTKVSQESIENFLKVGYKEFVKVEEPVVENTTVVESAVVDLKKKAVVRKRKTSTTEVKPVIKNSVTKVKKKVS